MTPVKLLKEAFGSGNPEDKRLREARGNNTPWKKWGPYLNECQ